MNVSLLARVAARTNQSRFIQRLIICAAESGLDFTKLETCRDPARFRPWLLSITRHAALNHVRADTRRHEHALENRVADGTPGPSSALAAKQTRAEIVRALQQLSPMQREVVILADLESLPHAEIAQRTGLSVLMSRRHLSDARRRLRNLLRIRP